MNGKSTLLDPAESLGRRLEARVEDGKGKCVRERKVHTERKMRVEPRPKPPLVPMWYKRRFFMEGRSMRSYLSAWRNYADFSGCTTRHAFFVTIAMDCMIRFAVQIGIGVAMVFWTELDPDRIYELLSLLNTVYGVAFLIPCLSMTVRRLNDAGYSAKSFWWLLVPVIGGIALLARLAGRSMPRDEML